MKSVRKIFSALVLGAVCCWMLSPAMSTAETMTWRVQNSYSDQVQIEFYSQNRKYAWPSGGRAYALYDRRVYRIQLLCNPGEYICYGAWLRENASKYWGVGPKNRYRCNDCCYYCENTAIPLRLLD